jgi:spore coat protein A
LPHTRRTFLQNAAALGLTSTALGRRATVAQQMTMPMPASARPSAPKQLPNRQLPKMLHNLELPPFVDPMPLPQIARPGAHGRIRIAMREIHAQVHRDVPPTRMWSYGPTALAPLIEARSGEPLHVEWVNQLPAHHFLPIDYSLHGCGHDIPEVRACVHLHGGRTPSASDGYPEDWYVPGASRLCTYPLQQDAATLWYHDHAMGLNRLNIYAGLFGMAVVRDRAEDALGLPSGEYEVPITLYDRNFSADGQLFYPESGIPGKPWVSEFEGDAILLNGKIRPYFEVEPRLYRFRLLNAANSRFFNLSLSDKGAFHQVGSDQGLLSAPLHLPRIFIAPAERADVLIDFSAVAGQKVHMLNAALPVLEFRVAGRASGGKTAYSLPTQLRTIDRIPESTATVTRRITLDEAVDHIGNSMLMYLDKKRWHEPTTEFPKLGSTEIWEFINLTPDVHPLHLHMVRFQILDRRLFDVFAYRNYKGMRYFGDVLQPEPNELGWKDVVQCPAEQVTRIIVKFDGYAGRYLYHCHILEHEANDMMRPFEVLA